MAKISLPNKMKGSSTSSLPPAPATLPKHKRHDWGHCTSCCPWPQKMKTSDIVVSMATSLGESWLLAPIGMRPALSSVREGGSVAPSSCWEHWAHCSQTLLLRSARLPEEHTGLTQCLPQAEFNPRPQTARIALCALPHASSPAKWSTFYPPSLHD